jgi:hypothetical protein
MAKKIRRKLTKIDQKILREMLSETGAGAVLREVKWYFDAWAKVNAQLANEKGPGIKRSWLRSMSKLCANRSAKIEKLIEQCYNL